MLPCGYSVGVWCGELEDCRERRRAAAISRRCGSRAALLNRRRQCPVTHDGRTKSVFRQDIINFCQTATEPVSTIYLRRIRQALAEQPTWRTIFVDAEGVAKLVSLISDANEFLWLEVVDALTNLAAESELAVQLSVAVGCYLVILATSSSHTLQVGSLGCLSNLCVDGGGACSVLVSQGVSDTLHRCLDSTHGAVRAAAAHTLAMLMMHADTAHIRDVPEGLCTRVLALLTSDCQCACMCLCALSLRAAEQLDCGVSAAAARRLPATSCDPLHTTLSRLALTADSFSPAEQVLAADALMHALIHRLYLLERPADDAHMTSSDDASLLTRLGDVTCLVRALTAFCLLRHSAGAVVGHGSLVKVLVALLTARCQHLRRETMPLVANLLYSTHVHVRQLADQCSLGTRLAVYLQQVHLSATSSLTELLIDSDERP